MGIVSCGVRVGVIYVPVYLYFYIYMCSCLGEFGLFFRKHHCRLCGFVFCDDCSEHRMEISSRNGGSEEGAVRVSCYVY